MSRRERHRRAWVLAGLVALTAGAASAEPRREAHVVGSSTLYPFVAVVAEAFAGTSDREAPVVEATGTGGGFKLFCAGLGLNTPDVVTASRPITPDERALCAAHGVGDIASHELGYGGVVMAEARKAGAKRGTRDIFAEVVMRGGCSAFREVQVLAAGERREICEHFREDGVFIQAGENDDRAVRRVADDQSMGNALRRYGDLVVGIPLEGVRPDDETIASGSYPVSRELLLYVKTAHFKTVPTLEAFVREITGQAAIGEDGYLADIGLIPLRAGDLEP